MNSLKRLHQDQHGAIALAVMAALLICFMLSLVIFDSTFVTRQKIEVQAAADSAAWSQSAVESRSMNMIAFANIGKRVTIGMTVFYEALWAGWAALFALTLIVTVALLALCIATWGSVCTPFEKSLQVLIEIGVVMAQEAEDLGKFFGDIKEYLQNDVKSFDEYQKYMSTITPWWSWAESWVRGYRNGAGAVGTFPPPKNLTGEVSIPGVGSLGSGIDDELPIEKDSNYTQLCKRAMFPDLVAHGLDYLAKTITCGDDCTDEVTTLPTGTRYALYVAAGLFAAALYWGLCETFADATFNEEGKPYQMVEFSNEADWLLASSNLVFSYRPGMELMTDMRNKYRFIDKDYTASNPVSGYLYEADGQFGMARSEISFQGETEKPDLWHCAYSPRMRPLAFPGEWEGYPGDIRMVTAWHDAVPYMAGGSLVGFLGGGMGSPDDNDFVRMELAIDALNNDYVDGLPR